MWNFFLEYMKYAYGIVSEYLAEDLSKKLQLHLNLPDDSEIKKRKLSSPKDAADEKRHKKETREETKESPKSRALDLTKTEKVCLVFSMIFSMNTCHLFIVYLL